MLLLPVPVWPDKLNEQREAFLQAENFLAEKNEARFFEISPSLIDYPLYPYLRYQWMKGHLDNSDQVLAFLNAYKDTRYAGLLRSRWLDYLAGQGRWLEFVRVYEQDENSPDDCRWHWARYQTGMQGAALSEAKRLWLAGETVDKACQPLFSMLEKSTLLTPELVWQRFESAIENDHYNLAKATASLLNQTNRQRADDWLRLHQKPELFVDQRFWQDKNAQTGRLFAHVVKQLANSNLEKAMMIWDMLHPGFEVETPVSDAVERKFGMALLGKKDRRAFSRLNKLKQPDEEARAAKIRAALLEQDWQHVNSAIAGLAGDERQEPKWQYWQAKALHATGKTQQAKALYTALANDRSFYGFLAADFINAPYRIIDNPVKASNEEIKQLSDSPDFKACWEFMWLGKEMEARRQWQFAIKKLPKEKLLIAAKLAQQWHWDQQAITTLVKADYWDDMALRFPLTYLAEVQASAEAHHVEPALMFGLMRQESMLDRNAESSVGAKGLMQLMPETAMTIAKSLHEPWHSEAELFSPDLNIRYGGYYFRGLLTRFDNHVAVAGAAYNAGPGRAKKWLPDALAVPADIWIETIPFKETRKYVATVLSYAIIYQQRLQKGKLKLKELLRDIAPKEKLS